jgi:hypothetical protein
VAFFSSNFGGRLIHSGKLRLTAWRRESVQPNLAFMHPLRALLIYLVLVFVLGAALAPWLYEFVQWAAGLSPIFEKLARNPFHRFVHRSLLAMAVLGLWPLLRSLRMRSWREIGLVGPAGQWGNLGMGFALGFGSLACVAALALACGARTVHPAPVLSKLLSAALSAVFVGILEEILFRGALFGGLRKGLHWVAALLISGSVYAIVHFFQRPPSPEKVTWSSGFELLPPMVRGFVEVKALVPGFLILLLAGAILGLAYQRTGTLYCSIGLHAGWIFWLKSYAVFTTAHPGADAWFWGTNKLIDGWLALGALTPVLFLAQRLTAGRPAGSVPG